MRTNKCPFGIPDCKYKMYSTSRVFIYIIQYQTQLGLNFVLPHPFLLKLCNLFCPLLLSLPFGYYFSLKKHIGSVNLLTPLTAWFFYVCSCIMIICVLEHSCIFPLYGCLEKTAQEWIWGKIVFKPWQETSWHAGSQTLSKLLIWCTSCKDLNKLTGL